MADFTLPLECTLEDIDWPIWDSAFDVTAAISPISNFPQVRTPLGCGPDHPAHIDDVTEHISSSNSESRDASTGNLFKAPYPSPANSVNETFSSRSLDFFSAGHTSGSTMALGVEPQAEHGPGALFSFSSRIPPFVTCEPNVETTSAPSDRCILQCHINLTNQLTELAKFHVNSSSVTLDVLLNLDDDVSKARDTVLGCPFCLVTPRSAQTLMLLTMVVGDLLSLSERSCATFMVNTTTASSPSSKSSHFISRPPDPLSSTMCPLTVGEIQLDETLKGYFARCLISMYLNRQLLVVQQLSQRLGGGHKENVSLKITQELLGDVLRRIECFVAFMTLKGARKIRPVY
ncbi:hypothetical protein BP6252_11342 [Coleophoma cylindrospora]|uniref:Aflatoxin regulatory protein domain-containing protein n=1 Tax=Coleophoma cylindrospora TaxID=1849047 RepID=A0A3D8QPT9_9HELO|nr:hypothetical protein BP6252_11342 [Coleophoma cylindrospora]